MSTLMTFHYEHCALYNSTAHQLLLLHIPEQYHNYIYIYIYICTHWCTLSWIFISPYPNDNLKGSFILSWFCFKNFLTMPPYVLTTFTVDVNFWLVLSKRFSCWAKLIGIAGVGCSGNAHCFTSRLISCCMDGGGLSSSPEWNGCLDRNNLRQITCKFDGIKWPLRSSIGVEDMKWYRGSTIAVISTKCALWSRFSHWWLKWSYPLQLCM